MRVLGVTICLVKAQPVPRAPRIRLSLGKSCQAPYHIFVGLKLKARTYCRPRKEEAHVSRLDAIRVTPSNIQRGNVQRVSY
jgi:hypothetical protein